ncbi:Threonine synthase [Petrocella atlantisensis]|uniref:Threonine synthase n=1 Tax=Petrocella atlantisensis TaxID=2173034 RepID=A0A3P7PGN8_9FIRM|nr:threonine synthase [Petrocella atlantisensis]VDN49193.1 Threonine synthase [Petrocella atlantisensis]
MDKLLYKSTRGLERDVSASYAIVKGLAKDGGLYVPSYIPQMNKSMTELSEMNYQDLAYEVMSLYYQDFTEEELRACIHQAYDHKFDTDAIAPTIKVGDVYMLELFHGSTIAFKDMALSILPYLMKTAAKKIGIEKEIVILTATSGDTGKAALAGFADVEDTKIIVFYPKDGVSPIQKKQMVTQKGDNTFVVGIEGNFDDAQNGVKRIFSDLDFNKALERGGFQFSSANSINIGRLIPQIAYYFYTYATLIKQKEILDGETINVAVPTGNFGNILAAYYAKAMGLPLGKLICASNDNKVLFDFIRTGKYDRQRPFILTMSPSMDILISSNLERLIYEIAGADSTATKDLMEDLTSKGFYEVTDRMKAGLSEFYGNYANQLETQQTIKKVFEKNHYLMDPHTAVGYAVYEKYVEDSGDTTKTVVVSTASPYKFTKSTMISLDQEYGQIDDFELIDRMREKTGVEIPEAIHEILEASIRHNTICKHDEMASVIKKFLQI